MKALMRVLAVPILLALVLSGCWDRNELNNLAIILAAGVDYVDGMYEVSVQTIDPSQTSKNPKGIRSAAILYSERGPTLIEAARKMTIKRSRLNYTGHIRLYLLGESIARRGITEALEVGFRLPGIRPDYYIAITRGYTAKEILSLVTPFEQIPAMDFVKSLAISEAVWAPTTAVRALEMQQILLSDSRQPVLTGITVIGDFRKGQTAGNVKQPKSPAEYRYTGLGVIKNDKLVGWMNESDSKSYAYIHNLVKSTIASTECPNSSERFAIELNRVHTSLKPLVRNGEPAMKLAMQVESNLAEVNCDIDLTKEASIAKLESLMREKVKDVMSDGIRHVQQQYGADIYGFGEAFYRKYPKQWRTWHKDWETRFRELPIEFDIRYRIERMGKNKNSVKSNPDKGGRTEWR
ncbi:Ger(x)C family spore germination protein [Cohnella panacarvi]|uniref:Ger(x)C family spore germination protein n=1 Tax=Cohnella panacarvi TaxID=400776 RepID=UPI00047C575A|nr:Ger(x)C family spore germination protein [Cohnella panacarvi]